MEIVDGDGRGIRMNRGDGIGRVGETETDQTVGFLNLCDGLAHQETAVLTGMKERGRWRSGIGEGIMNYTVGIGIGIGRMLQTDAAPIGSIDVLGAIKALIIVEVETVGMEIVEAMMTGGIIDRRTTPGIFVVVDMRDQ